jgi:hypothetical protein
VDEMTRGTKKWRVVVRHDVFSKYSPCDIPPTYDAYVITAKLLAQNSCIHEQKPVTFKMRRRQSIVIKGPLTVIDVIIVDVIESKVADKKLARNTPMTVWKQVQKGVSKQTKETHKRQANLQINLCFKLYHTVPIVLARF